MAYAYLVIHLLLGIYLTYKIIKESKENANNLPLRVENLKKLRILTIGLYLIISILGIVMGNIMFGTQNMIEETGEVLRIEGLRKVFDNTTHSTEGYQLYSLTWKETEIERMIRSILGGMIFLPIMVGSISISIYNNKKMIGTPLDYLK